MLIYFETARGCGIREYRDLPSAKVNITRETGTYDPPSVIREATEEDISWVRAMGGFVPKQVSAPNPG